MLAIYASLFDLSNFLHASLFEKFDHPWLAIAGLNHYLENQTLGIQKGIISKSAYLINSELITIGEGTVVEAGSFIQGPCIIGKNCQIRHGAYIRGNVLTGDDCVIGHDTEVKNSIFLNGSHAAHFAYLGDSIIGNKVNLGAGVKCANLRLDKEKVKIMFHGERINTGMKKLGALIGDDSQIGCGVVINPGTMIEKKVISHPNTVLEGFIPSGSLVKSASKPLIIFPS